MRARRVLERRRKKTAELAKPGDARRVAAIAAAKKVKEAQKRVKEQQQRGDDTTKHKADLAQRRSTEKRLVDKSQPAEREERVATKGAVAREEKERRRVEQEAKQSDENRAALARAREEELQRQLSEAEAAQIVAEELTRRREWLQQVPTFEPIVADVEGVAFLNAGERDSLSVVLGIICVREFT